MEEALLVDDSNLREGEWQTLTFVAGIVTAIAVTAILLTRTNFTEESLGAMVALILVSLVCWFVIFLVVRRVLAILIEIFIIPGRARGD